MFVPPPPIPNIESLSQTTISSLDSGSFGRNRAGVNIQQATTSGLANTDTVMAYNEDLDPPLPQDISNVFAAADLLSFSSSDPAKYKCAWIKAKVVCSSILYAGECPDACSRALSIVLNHKEIASVMSVNGTIFQENMPMQLSNTKKRKNGPM